MRPQVLHRVHVAAALPARASQPKADLHSAAPMAALEEDEERRLKMPPPPPLKLVVKEVRSFAGGVDSSIDGRKLGSPQEDAAAARVRVGSAGRNMTGSQNDRMVSATESRNGGTAKRGNLSDFLYAADEETNSDVKKMRMLSLSQPRDGVTGPAGGREPDQKRGFDVRDDRMKVLAAERAASGNPGMENVEKVLKKKPPQKTAYLSIDNRFMSPLMEPCLPAHDGWKLTHPWDPDAHVEYQQSDGHEGCHASNGHDTETHSPINSHHSELYFPHGGMLLKGKTKTFELSQHQERPVANGIASKDLHSFERSAEPVAKKLKFLHSMPVKELQENAFLPVAHHPQAPKPRKRKMNGPKDSSTESSRPTKVAKLSKFVEPKNSGMASESFQNRGKTSASSKKPGSQPHLDGRRRIAVPIEERFAFYAPEQFTSETATKDLTWALGHGRMAKGAAALSTSMAPPGFLSAGRKHDTSVQSQTSAKLKSVPKKIIGREAKEPLSKWGFHGKAKKKPYQSLSWQKENEDAEFVLTRRTEELSSLDLLVQAASGFEAQLRSSEVDQSERDSYNSEDFHRQAQRLITEEDSDATIEDGIAELASFSGSSKGKEDDAEEDDSLAVKNIVVNFPSKIKAPLVRSRRGRAQALPSRFCDSVLEDPWKKRKRRSVQGLTPVEKRAPIFKQVEQNKITFDDNSLSDFVPQDSMVSSPYNEQLVSGFKHGQDGETSPDVEYNACDEKPDADADRRPPTRMEKPDLDADERLSAASNSRPDLDAGQRPFAKISRRDLDTDQRPSTSIVRTPKKPWKKSHKQRTNPCSEVWNRQSLNHAGFDKITSVLESEEEKNIYVSALPFVFNLDIGDIVWAKLGASKDMVWPGKVINSTKDVPESVLRAGHSYRLCVMFYGPPTRNEGERDYAWVKRSMVFPFMENLDRFQRQTNSRPTEFKLAIEEAILVECGIDHCKELLKDHHPSVHPTKHHNPVFNTSDAVGQWDLPKSIELPEKKDVRCKVEDSCMDCKVSSEEAPRNHLIEGKKTDGTILVVPDQIAVVCYGKEAKYIPKFHQVLCECEFCNTGQMMGPSKWERHTGSRKKKWKESIKLKNSNNTLLSWLHFMLEHGASGLAYTESNSNLPSRQRERKLAACLQASYEPVVVNWTAERCAVCRWVEDYEWNKIIICNRCGIAVHEECYGKRAFDCSFICRVCENPDVEHECCLCPVKGGALKPSTIYGFWVHITCAWFIEEVSFKNAVTMEPADGLTKIDAARFRQACAVCKQIHGVCIQCAKCPTAYHVMCAARAGYRMELHSLKSKGGSWLNKKITYCADHRAPDPDAKLFLASSEGKHRIGKSFEGKDNNELLSISNNVSSGSENMLASETSYASRCQEYTVQMKLLSIKKLEEQTITHTVSGFSWHSPEVINSLRQEEPHIREKASLHNRLVQLQRTEKSRVCCGRSAIHGWGLFARHPIQEGEMVVVQNDLRNVYKLIRKQHKLSKTSQLQFNALYKDVIRSLAMNEHQIMPQENGDAKKPGRNGSVTRAAMNGNIRQGKMETIPFLHLKRKEEHGWEYSKKLTGVYLEGLENAAKSGLTFQGKMVLMTGAGAGSIGAEVLQGLIAGGAKVVVTTSRFSREVTEYYQSMYARFGAKGSQLVVVPFNQGSKQDVDALINYIYDNKKGLGWDLDFIIPFAAIPENGREIDSIDSKSELAHRIMLTNLLRLLGATKAQKAERGFNTRPAQVILPLSPNHGTFGNDGLYSESKLALETLFNRWYSESWSDYLTICGAIIGWTRGTGLMSGNNVVAEGVEKYGVRTFSQQEMAFNLLGLMSPAIVDLCQNEPVWADLNGGLQFLPDLKDMMTKLRSEIMETSAVRSMVTKENAIENKIVNGEDSEALYKKVVIEPRANIKFEFPELPKWEEDVAPLNEKLKGMVDLDKVVVVTGFSELGPWGNSRTRWEMEAYGEFSLEGCIEMAWMMGMIKNHNGPLKGKSYSGWVDAKSGDPVDDKDVKAKYEKQILEHSGIRLIEPELFGGYDPEKKMLLQEIQIEEDLDPFEAAKETAEEFKHQHGDKVEIFELESGEYSVRLKKNATLLIPKALRFDRLVAGQIPTGWSAKHYGIPDDIISQVDPVTLFVLVCTVEALLAAGITDPYEFYKYVHLTEVGNCVGSGMGGAGALKGMYKDRFMDKPVQKDILQESFINTMSAWVNMLLLSSTGPIKTPVGACATAVESIDIGYETIVEGKARVVLVGGFDDFSEEGSYEFGNMKATSNADTEFAHGRTPKEMSRPTTTTRAGFMEAQGCGMQILMSARLALDMGTPIYGIVALTTTATDKIGRSVPAPGQGVLTTARENPGKFPSPLLDISYRRRQLELRKKNIKLWQESELLYLDEEVAAMKQQTGFGFDEKSYVEDRIAHIERDAQRQISDAQFSLGNNFWKQDSSIAPLRGALATWGLTVDDLGVASFHGTSTVANDKNESDVICKQMAHLGRQKGNAVLGIFQKYLTGHPKGAAGAWMFNGCLQVLNTGLVPGNRNADNVDPVMEKFDYIVYPSRSLQTDGIKAFSVTSFGFGQKGAQAIGIHPKYLFATLDQAEFNRYKLKVEARQKKAYRYFHNGLINNSLFVAKSKSPYADEIMSQVFLNPDSRVITDKKTGEYVYPSVPAKKLESASAKQTREMLEQITKATAADNSKVGVDVEDILAIHIDDETFVERNFTVKEQAYCKKAPSPQASFAGRWSAKEAVFKALGVNSKGAGAPLVDIEILSDEKGAPKVELHGQALAAAKQAGVKNVNVSISHSETQAIAVAISAF